MKEAASMPRWFDFLLGGALLIGGSLLIMTLLGAPLGIPMFAAGLALLLDSPK